MKRPMAIAAVAMLASVTMSVAADIVDGVVAIVNDKVITYSEVMDLVQPVDRELRRTYSGQELEEQRRKAQRDALDSLIERALIIQEFNTKGYKLPDTVVEQRINDIIANEYGGNRAAFTKTLEAENLTLSQFREKERERVIVQAMRSHKTQQTIVASPYRIETYYHEHIEDFKVGDQIKLRMIFIKRGEPVVTGTTVSEPAPPASTNQPAAATVTEPAPPAPTNQVAATSPESQGLQTNTNTEAAVAATNTEPVAVSSTTTVAQAAATVTNPADISLTNGATAVPGSETNALTLVQKPVPPVPSAIDLQRKLAEEILAKLDAGDTFESLARTYSEGKEAREGGDWGWIGRDILRKELNETAFSLKPHQHSHVIETAEGYYILEVDGVKPAHTTPLPEVRDDIEKTLLQEQRTKMQEEWVKDLRARAYIRLF
jgi:parvulin-like peptidyl-prolyl isomerase